MNAHFLVAKLLDETFDFKKLVNMHYESDFLRKHVGFEKCKLRPDGRWDVAGNVDIVDMNLTDIPVKFGRVSGHFDCSFNRLTRLYGSPLLVDKYFNCSNNQLTSLQGAPESVGGNFNCSYNKLTSFQGAPLSVGGKFYGVGNKNTGSTS